ncbi:CbtB domain-containing protein [Aureimonas frigidaquae]|uniref:CbtB domain-containing protein n=1 Tax=Aureimonas frigidaquae TaxID=424757 RepID=UPI000780E159|nr:CbtB domain-containing protein [Aureimonas frigidaquae]
MTTRTASRTPSDTATRFATGLLALALGGFLIFGAGFASADQLHDTAHDARHAMGLPCH